MRLHLFGVSALVSAMEADGPLHQTANPTASPFLDELAGPWDQEQEAEPID